MIPSQKCLCQRVFFACCGKRWKEVEIHKTWIAIDTVVPVARKANPVAHDKICAARDKLMVTYF